MANTNYTQLYFTLRIKKVINVESQSPDNNNALNKFQQFIDKQK